MVFAVLLEYKTKPVEKNYKAQGKKRKKLRSVIIEKSYNFEVDGFIMVFLVISGFKKSVMVCKAFSFRTFIHLLKSDSRFSPFLLGECSISI